jgi:hypothetical protein
VEIKFPIGTRVAYIFQERAVATIPCKKCQGQGFFIDSEGYKVRCNKTDYHYYPKWVVGSGKEVSEIVINKQGVLYVWRWYSCGDEGSMEVSQDELFATAEEAMAECNKRNEEFQLKLSEPTHETCTNCSCGDKPTRVLVTGVVVNESGSK